MKSIELSHQSIDYSRTVLDQFLKMRTKGEPMLKQHLNQVYQQKQLMYLD